MSTWTLAQLSMSTRTQSLKQSMPNQCQKKSKKIPPRFGNPVSKTLFFSTFNYSGKIYSLKYKLGPRHQLEVCTRDRKQEL